MTEPTRVFYNASCPICSREIAIYRARAEGGSAPVEFTDITDPGLARLGIDAETAARSLHVVENGKLLSGTDAFLALWRATPGFGWLARLVGNPAVKPLAAVTYDRLLAPLLFALHRRRQRRAGPAR